MQRHLALLLYLFPLPQRRSREERSADQLLDLAKKRLDELHARHREQAVIALTQKNNLQSQVDDLQKTVQNLQEKAEAAVRKGENALADKLLREKQSYELSLRSAEETLQQAVETGEQVKRALDREEEQVRAKTAQILALQLEWKGTQIEEAMQEQLESMGLWHLTQEPAPRIDRQTARELVGFLLLLVLVLLIGIGRLL
ncbi:PspA/IM30 family protein [Armatimonas rosea]|uniref:Phage shock protein A n=1 Tax=Armatimonas rosea TaxID=685828 RepID=A0A7W9WAJ3_ARMRO|nr:PspA/IM30 family protein [Armatimonas rosea]MBB6053672.1 phage shock protein A [Armatimonas rosea]